MREAWVLKPGPSFSNRKGSRPGSAHSLCPSAGGSEVSGQHCTPRMGCLRAGEWGEELNPLRSPHPQGQPRAWPQQGCPGQ